MKKIIISVCLMFNIGCGAAVSPEVVSYATAEMVCNKIEEKIVSRDNSTEERDLRDIRFVRMVCDDILREIELEAQTSGGENK